MQEIMLIAILVFSNFCPPITSQITTAIELAKTNDPVFISICHIESDFEKTAKSNGCAGIAQISQPCIDDVNETIGKKKYTKKDCFDVTKSYEIYKIYRDKYVKGEKTVEACATLWNGGPGGRNSKHAKSYASKVKQYYIRNKLASK